MMNLISAYDTYYVLAFAPLIYAARCDVLTRKIPNSSVIALSVLALLRLLLATHTAFGFPRLTLLGTVTGGAFAFFFFMLFAVIDEKGIGGGDIKLYSALGLICGVNGIISVILITTLVAAIYGKIRKKRTLPMAPFMLIGYSVFFCFNLM